MWEIVQVGESNKGYVESYLKEGYEPFAVSADSRGYATIWFRREKAEELLLRFRDKPPVDREVVNEVHSEPKPVKRTGGRTTTKTQG